MDSGEDEHGCAARHSNIPLSQLIRRVFLFCNRRNPWTFPSYALVGNVMTADRLPKVVYAVAKE